MMYWDRGWHPRGCLEMVLRMARIMERRMSGDTNEKLPALAAELEALFSLHLREERGFRGL